MCSKHLARFRRYGDPMARGKYKVVRAKGYTLESRFWSRVNKDGPIQPNMTTPCWEWIGAPSHRYGQFGFQGKRYSVHRLGYELMNGPMPPDMLACHECDNPRCVRGDHIFPGTPLDNMRDKYAKGRQNVNAWRIQQPEAQPRGERVNTAILTAEKILEVQQRFDAGEDTKLLALEYGVSRTQIYRLGNRDQWQHLGTEKANRPKHSRYAHKLDEDKVREIRQRADNGENPYDLAKEMDVHVTTIQGVINRRRYKNIE
jgi:Mor family transcriptional regulator